MSRRLPPVHRFLGRRQARSAATICLAAAAAMLLHACGGGGGDSGSAATAPAFTFTRIADTTSTAPGTGAGTLRGFEGSNASTLSQSGDVTAFFSGYIGGSGIFIGSGGALTTIVKAGDAVPGGGAFTSVSRPSQTGTTTAFGGRWLETANFGQLGVFRSVGGTSSLLVKTGTALGGVNVVGPELPSASGDATAFLANFTLFVLQGGVGARVATVGGAAPGGGTFEAQPNGDTPFGGPYQSGTTTVFTGRVTGGNGLFARSGNLLGVIARTGDAVPGVAGATFTSFGDTADGRSFSGFSHSGGTTAFVGNYANDAQGGLFVKTGTGALATIAKPGDPAPIGGVHDGFNFSSAVAQSGGSTAFVASAGGTRFIALQAGPGQPAVVVLKTGDALFGSTVTRIDGFGGGSYDGKKLAFVYRLANGQNGIAVATDMR